MRVRTNSALAHWAAPSQRVLEKHDGDRHGVVLPVWLMSEEDIKW